MYHRILVATDGSELAAKAEQNAIALAALTKAELVIVKVVGVYPQSYFEGALSIDVQEISRVENKWLDAGQSVVNAIKTKAEEAGVKTEAVVVKSERVSDAILAVAKKHECDLIVMASHGRNGLQRLLLGSETQSVLAHAHIPVLVLR